MLISIKTKFGGQKVMNLVIQKRRGMQLRAGWSIFHAVSSHLRSIYAKSVDLLKSPILCWSLEHQFGACPTMEGRVYNCELEFMVPWIRDEDQEVSEISRYTDHEE